MFDRTVYFDLVRDSPFSGKLTKQQVDGQNVLLGEWEKVYWAWDIRWLAYTLATTFHETAAKMWPITEYGSQSYLQGKPYYPYIGRGFVQLTWEDNYRNATSKLGLTGKDDLVVYPDRALDVFIATNVIFRGMAEGWFTGKKFKDYFNNTVDDPINARRIVNGNDKDTLIAGYHWNFLAALNESSSIPAPEPEPEPAPEIPRVLVAITQPPGISVVVTINGEFLNTPTA